MLRAVARLLCFALTLFGVSFSTHARATQSVEQRARDEEDDDSLRLRFVLPVWLPLLAMEGSAQSEGSGTDLFETETEVRWVVIGMLEAGYRPIVARVDAFGVGFGDRVLFRDGKASNVAYDSSGLIARAVLSYEFGPYRLSRTSKYKKFVFAPLAGARYNGVKLDLTEPSELDADYAWIDPLAGARTEFMLGRWRLGTHLDVGGFGVSSELAFWAAATVEYMILDFFSIWLGWQHYQVLFEHESERTEERIRLYLTGPSAGFGLHLF
jgi:hypothetical protein